MSVQQPVVAESLPPHSVPPDRRTPTRLLTRVRHGIQGPYPSLSDLEDGDPRHAIDYRRIYATVHDRWLNCPSQSVLGKKFTHVDVL